MGNKNENLIAHIKNAFIYTFDGLKAAWKNELAFRGEVVVVMIMLTTRHRSGPLSTSGSTFEAARTA